MSGSETTISGIGSRTGVDASLDTLAVLQDPVRRRLYRHVVAQGREVGRDEAADALAIQRSLAAFHLDKLADAGLLDVSYRRLGKRRGPGAGRPAKLYRRAQAEYDVTVPPRAYEMAARMLAEAVESAEDDAELQGVARRHGVETGQTAAERRRMDAPIDADADEEITEMLAAHGYEPYRDGEVLRLRNCPFHTVALMYPPLICGMNLAFLRGLVEGAGMTRRAARMDPRPGQCCVAISKTNAS